MTVVGFGADVSDVGRAMTPLSGRPTLLAMSGEVHLTKRRSIDLCRVTAHRCR